MTTLNCFFSITWGSIADWIMVLITILGFGFALFQFWNYRKELKNRTFLEFRQRFKSDEINIRVLEYISKNDNSTKKIPSEYDVNHFLGFYEELHKMLLENQISIDDLIYYFGNYYLKVFEDSILFERIKINDLYWIRSVDLYKRIKMNKSESLEKLRTIYNHKEILKYLKENR